MQILKGDFKRIPLELIHSPKQSSREVFEGIAELAQTIKAHGLLQPITVQKSENRNGYEVVIGSRRLRACQRAGLQVVPSIVVDRVSPEQLLEIQIIENLQRKDLLPFEEIRLVQSLKDLQQTHEEIAAQIGVSVGTIADLIIIGEKIPHDLIKSVIRVKGGKPARKELTISKAVLLARANLSEHELRKMVHLIHVVGYSKQMLAQKLARSYRSKIRRVHASRTMYAELTKKLKDYIKRFAEYWKEYTTLKEWESVDAFHLNLKIVLPKDLNEKKEREETA